MVGIDRRSALPVENFRLYSNYPNPFNPVTKILFELNRSTGIDIFIYNLLGEVVRRLFKGNLAVGRHEIEWDGRNDSGVAQASGVYFAKLTAGSQTQAIKIILQR
jgi:flagellar hook assembly protein FlgD